MASTPLRNIRVEDELWQAAKATAERRGENLTAVLVDALRSYVAEHAGPGERTPEAVARDAAARARDALDAYLLTAMD